MTYTTKIILTIAHDDHVDREQADADAEALRRHLRQLGNDPCADVPIDALLHDVTLVSTALS